MGWFSKKKTRTFDEVHADLESAIQSKNEPLVKQFLEELISVGDADVKLLEAYTGRAILIATEMDWRTVKAFVPWFLEQFPDSLFAVRIEYAKSLLSQR